MHSIARILFIVLVSAGIFMMAWITIPFLDGNYEQGFLLTKLNILHKSVWRWSFYIHITASLPVLITGLLQFIPSLLRNHPRLHRNSGKIYVLLILCLSAPSGFIMGFYGNGGWWAKVSFMLLSVAWWLSTYFAFRYIKKGLLQEHIHWVTRSYALTLSALALRTYVLILPLTELGVSAKYQYALVAWLSWVPNLIIAEIINRRGLIKKPE